MTEQMEDVFLKNLSFHEDCDNKYDINSESTNGLVKLHPKYWNDFFSKKAEASKDVSVGVGSKKVALRALSRVASFCNKMQNAMIQQSRLPCKRAFIGCFNQLSLGLG